MSHNQLPPNQQLAAPGKWPVVGERRRASQPVPWRLRISGAVQTPGEWTLDQLQQLRPVTRRVDIHCVTRWSKLAMPVTGVPLARLLEHCQPREDARFLSFIAASERGHTTSLPADDIARLDPLIVWEADGAPLTEEHGGPLRMIVPGRYFYKSVKWLIGIELLPEDRLGYWEATAGYHNHADPWREERYVTAGVSRQEAARRIAARDFRGQDLLSIDAPGLDLAELQAAGALLRNANFRGCRLVRADFAGANLSNAHLAGADLTAANLREADCEGADFSGACLREADLRGASLFGATFVELRDGGHYNGAAVDRTTLVDDAALALLAPPQAEYLAARLAGAAQPE